MMSPQAFQTFTQWFLPIYGLGFFLVCIVWRGLIVWRQTGRNPIHWSNRETAHGYAAYALRWNIIPAALSTVLYSFAPASYFILIPIAILEQVTIQIIGLIFLVLSLVWTAWGQAQMGRAWRIGVDRTSHTDLVTSGFFKYSRNPIYFGILVGVFGFFLTLPNALTLCVLVNCYFLFQVEVRLEEEHMRNLHGEKYLNYCKQVRRWV